MPYKYGIILNRMIASRIKWTKNGHENKKWSNATLKPRLWPLLKGIFGSMLVILPLTFTACGKEKTLDWHQEALLHDGRTLWVERHSERGSPFPGNSGLETGQTLAFSHPDTGERIEWRIPEGLQPVMLDFEQGVPYYVLDTYVSSDYSKWGCPNPPYLVYRYQQGKWKRVAFELLPAQFVILNLMRMSKDARGLVDGGRISVDQMEAYFKDGEQGTKKFRLILREKVNPIGKGCGADILFSQGRESEMDDKSRRDYEELVGMTEDSRRRHAIHMEKLKKELREKQ